MQSCSESRLSGRVGLNVAEETGMADSPLAPPSLDGTLTDTLLTATVGVQP